MDKIIQAYNKDININFDTLISTLNSGNIDKETASRLYVDAFSPKFTNLFEALNN